jgi:hypothetical protein
VSLEPEEAYLPATSDDGQGCALAVLGTVAAGWLVLLGLWKFGASMTSSCTYNVHTDACDHWRAANGVSFLLDVAGVVGLAVLALAWLLSTRVRRHPLLITLGVIAFVAVATVVNIAVAG